MRKLSDVQKKKKIIVLKESIRHLKFLEKNLVNATKKIQDGIEIRKKQIAQLSTQRVTK